MFSLESPHQGDSNEYTQYTIYNIKKENHSKLPKICSYGFCSNELKNEFETAVVNELSVFEPLKFYCMTILTCIWPLWPWPSTYLKNIQMALLLLKGNNCAKLFWNPCIIVRVMVWTNPDDTRTHCTWMHAHTPNKNCNNYVIVKMQGQTTLR